MKTGNLRTVLGRAILLMGAALLALSAFGLFGNGCSRRPETLSKDYDKAEMEAAIQKGRETFPEFKARLLQPQPGDANFAIKVKITDKHGTEYFWLTGIQIQGDQFTGIIDDEPGIVRNVKFRQSYSFTFDDVSDWLYLSKGVMQGNYTLRVLLKSMPAKEAAALKKQFGWE